MGLIRRNLPYIENEGRSDEVIEHTYLEVEDQRDYITLVKGGNDTKQNKKRNFVYTNVRRFTLMRIKVLIDVKNKSLNKTYKGLTSDMVKEVIRLERSTL